MHLTYQTMLEMANVVKDRQQWLGHAEGLPHEFWLGA
jgi:hypothetical protein